MSRLLREIPTRRFCRDFAIALLSAVGLSAIVVTVVAAFFPTLLPDRTWGVRAILLACALYAIWRVWPRRVIQKFDAGFTVELVMGNLFDQPGSTIIGMSDTFDVQRPDIIQSSGVQGQLLDRVWEGDAVALQASIEQALVGVPATGAIAKPGNTIRYAIGTVAAIRRESALYHCVAYTSLDEGNVASASLDGVTVALYRAWDSVDRHGNGGHVNIALIGQGMSRLNVLTPGASLRLLALTFVLRSNASRISEGLRIVLRKQDAERVDFREFAAFLATLPGARG